MTANRSRGVFVYMYALVFYVFMPLRFTIYNTTKRRWWLCATHLARIEQKTNSMLTSVRSIRYFFQYYLPDILDMFWGIFQQNGFRLNSTTLQGNRKQKQQRLIKGSMIAKRRMMVKGTHTQSGWATKGELNCWLPALLEGVRHARGHRHFYAFRRHIGLEKKRNQALGRCNFYDTKLICASEWLSSSSWLLYSLCVFSSLFISFFMNRV